MSEFIFILVRPRDPNNIGACARALGNFGFSRLRIVNPYTPTWQEAVSAVGAEDILKNAELFDSLPQALGDCHFSFASTALKNRNLTQKIVPLPDLASELKNLQNHKIAFVFGPEKPGLSNEEIAECTAVLNIPTAAQTPSINLAQAVILCCYELSKLKKTILQKPDAETGPTQSQKNLLIQDFMTLCQKVGLKDNIPAEKRRAALQRLLNKHGLNEKELFYLKKLIVQIDKQLP